MTTNLRVDELFPDIELPNHQNELTRLSQFTRPSLLDKHLGFLDGYPLILVFYRGFFCPRDQQQMRQLVFKIYNGWYFVGRPTKEELRHDLRAIMESRADYRYEAYTTPEVRQIRIPQQEWAEGAPPVGGNGLPVADGVVRWFDLNADIGVIARDGTGDEVFYLWRMIQRDNRRVKSHYLRRTFRRPRWGRKKLTSIKTRCAISPERP